MIKNQNRSYYIGASDTKYVVGNWDTKTFEKWWLVKLNLSKNDYKNDYMLAGTNFEHKILDFINAKQRDLQKKKGRLRVNIDGFTNKKIQEVKTYNYDKGFKLSNDYINQCQVEMYAFNTKECEIVAYGLLKEDYNNYFNEIDKDRLSIYKIKYDSDFIKYQYLPKLRYLEKCLRKKTFPILEKEII